MSDPTGYPELDALLPRLAAVPGLNADALAAEIVAVLGRKNGELTAALRSVPSRPAEERKSYGAAVNHLKARFAEAFAQRSEALETDRRQEERAGLDLIMPACHRWVGAAHSVTRVIDESVHIFRRISFTVAVGPEVGFDWYNFIALNIPPDHPAMH